MSLLTLMCWSTYDMWCCPSGVVQTAYANGSATAYVENVLVNFRTVTTCVNMPIILLLYDGCV